MNKPNSTPGQSFRRIRRAEQFVRTWTTLKSALTALALVAGAMFVPAALAQSVSFQGPMIRVTVPVGFKNTIVLSNNMAYTTNGLSPFPDGTGTNFVIQPITVNITGLPIQGVSYSLTNASALTNIIPFTATDLRTNSNNTLRLWVALTFDGTEPEGTYTFSENATGGATNNLLLTLDVAHIWNGSTNAYTDGASKWSTTTNWQGGGTPVAIAGANIIFNDLGGQTNSQTIIGGATNWLVNSIVDGNVTIASLRFAETNTPTQYHTLLINPGYSLTITGANGFSVLRDYVDELAGIGAAITVTILGTNASMIVNNTNSFFNDLVDAQISGCTLDMSRLDNFQATVNRFSLGYYATYPNFWNMDTNLYGNRFSGNPASSGNTSIPRRFLPVVNMARTNIVQTTFIGPDNYTNSSTRQYAVGYGSTAYGSGSTTQGNIWSLGVYNAFFADSMMIGGANQSPQNNFRFNPMFTNNNPIIVIRGMSGGNSRMRLFTIADDGSPDRDQSNVKDYVDYGSYNGQVDMLVDQMIIATDGKGILGNGATPNIQGSLMVGAGVIDANTMYLGYQTSGVHTNTGTFLGYCRGVLAVSNTAVVKINNTLTLGYTTETADGSTSAGAEVGNNWGQITINNGGTIMANTILVGGVTKGSQQNNITIASTTTTNISNLIVSNTIADSTQRLSTLAFGGNANMTLFVDGSLAVPYVYVTNLTTAGQNNIITIGAIKNMTYVGGIAQLPLIAYVSGSPAIIGVKMPPAFVGAGNIVQNGSTEWDLYVSTNAPNTNLLWRPKPGYGTTNWDNTSLIWSNRDNGMMTNFHTGDWVTFDDAPNLASNITQSVAILLPGKITMTNQSVKYTITGIGLQGSGILTKSGTGSLDIEGNASVAIALAQGIITNGTTSGTIGGVAVTAGATLINNLNGTINGGIVCAGTAINSGTINGTVGILSGGMVTNSSGANINGQPTFQDGALLLNSGTVSYPVGVTCTVSSNAMFLNNGIINGDYLTVNGTLEDTGAGYIALDDTLTINGSTAGTNPVGGLFIPGGDGVGTTKVMPAVSASSTYPGRVSLLGNSRIILKVTNNNNTLLYSGFQDFGPSANNNTYNGCTFVITNVGKIPFTNGSTFTMFQSMDSGGNPSGAFNYDGSSTNTYPLIQPLAPGTGLAWDLKYLYNWGPDYNNGKVGIIGTAVNPTNVLMVIFPTNGVIITTYPTNVPGSGNYTTNYATNNFIYTTLTWPTNHAGWRLQSQQNTLAVGLYTNWTTVFQTPWTNQLVLTNALITNNCWFYRMVYP